MRFYIYAEETFAMSVEAYVAAADDASEPLTLCKADHTPTALSRGPSTRTRGQSKRQAVEVVPEARNTGPHFPGTDGVFEDFVKTVMQSNTNALRWMCRDKFSERDGYVRGQGGIAQTTLAVGSGARVALTPAASFGVFISSTRVDFKDAVRCDQPVGFLMFREVKGAPRTKTRYVHIDLLCHGEKTDYYKSKGGLSLIAAMEAYFVRETTTGDLQFSLEAADDGSGKLIDVYEKRAGFKKVYEFRYPIRVHYRSGGLPVMVKKYARATSDGELTLDASAEYYYISLSRPDKHLYEVTRSDVAV